MRTILSFLAVLVSTALLLPAGFAQSSHAVAAEPGLRGQIRVPVDHDHPEAGSFLLEYELGRAFAPGKPTVILVADGQQFYVQHGFIVPIQKEIFGDDFNVVGVIGRGFNTELRAQVVHGSAVDWRMAYRVYRWQQWAADIEAVRRELLGPEGNVCLYGRSGGALLVDQYLSLYPRHVSRVFTQAALNPDLSAEYRLNPDHFWQQLGDDDPHLQQELLSSLAKHPDDRATIMLLLQRQNFFVEADQIAAARRTLVHALDRWDEEAIGKYKSDYQVTEVLKMISDNEDPALSVRLFEFLYPLDRLGRDRAGHTEARVDPDYEVQRLSAAPLLALYDQNAVPEPEMYTGDFHRTGADVFLLAGCFDHVADYRIQIAVASSFVHHHLLLLRDGHDFLALGKTGIYPQLVHDVLLYGSSSPQVKADEDKLQPLRYSEF